MTSFCSHSKPQTPNNSPHSLGGLPPASFSHLISAFSYLCSCLSGLFSVPWTLQTFFCLQRFVFALPRIPFPSKTHDFSSSRSQSRMYSNWEQWAWCGGCIARQPKTRSLTQQFIIFCNFCGWGFQAGLSCVVLLLRVVLTKVTYSASSAGCIEKAKRTSLLCQSWAIPEV